MILHGDCLERLKELEENSVDSVVTDPPYGWRFMGKAWDGADIEKMAKAATGKQPRLCADGKTRKPRENCAGIAAGKYDNSLTGNQSFQVFTESYAKELYRVLKPGGHMLIFCGPRTYHRMASGVEDAGFEIRDQLQWLFGSGFPKSHNIGNGIGTALKPANEPIVLARKPLEKGLTVAQNVLKWGVGGLNIDVSRIGTENETDDLFRSRQGGFAADSNIYSNDPKFKIQTTPPQGRWPANLILDETAAEMLGEPSRFFYCAKASKSERNAGLVTSVGANIHPTVKPIKLMEYLCRLITPPGATILDPFCGSGSTGVAAFKNNFKFIGIEMNEEYVEIAKRRIESIAL